MVRQVASRDDRINLNLSEEVAQEWFVWRLVFAKVCTLRELETFWSIDDALTAHEILDAQEECERKQMEKAKKKK